MKRISQLNGVKICMWLEMIQHHETIVALNWVHVLCITYLGEESIVPIRPFGMDEGHEKRRDCADGRGDEYGPHDWHAVYKDAGGYVG